MDVEIKGQLGFEADEHIIVLTPKGVAYSNLPTEHHQEGYDFQKFSNLNDAVVHVLLKFIEQLIKGQTLASMVYKGVEEDNADNESNGNQDR